MQTLRQTEPDLQNEIGNADGAIRGLMRENDSLRSLSFKLRSALGLLCALMEDDIETGKVHGSETRLRCLIEARSLLET
jgi:hypothetical protein